MTDDPYLTQTLPASLRTMAESDPPPAMDIDRVLHEGRHGLIRRRVAALGGGTAVLAATALAVGALAPAGGAGHRGDATDVTSPASPMRTLAAEVNQHDPVVTHYQFGYLPAGMSVHGGAGGMLSGFLGSGSGTSDAYGSSGFSMSLSDQTPVADPPGYPTRKIPADVAGAVQAYWAADENGQIVFKSMLDKESYATLHWQVPGGQWLMLAVSGIQGRPDWKEQAVRAASGVVKQDRSVPMPIRITEAPAGFQLMDGNVSRADGNTVAVLDYVAGPDVHSSPAIEIVAFRTGAVKLSDATMPRTVNTCADSNGLTVCVSGDDRAMRAQPLTAIGGAKALLTRVTSLGNDPANWTTDVIR